MRLLTRSPQPLGTSFTERRTRPRLQAKEGAFAFLSLAKMVAGNMLDINEHGLSFRYVASAPKVQGQRSVDIVMRDVSFHCHGLPCEAVWDRAEHETFTQSPFTIRCCGVRFGNLTEAQESEIKIFIRQHTKSEQTR